MQTYKKILSQKPSYLQVADEYKKLYKGVPLSGEIYLYVLAPTLIEYVEWLLENALIDGKKRIYFFSRDGYQMYLAAKCFVENCHFDIECRYLNVSRYALRVPEYHIIEKKTLDRICTGGIDVTFEKVMKRAGLSDKEAQEIAALCGYKDSYKQILSYRQVVQLKDILQNKEVFWELVYRHSKEAYQSVMGYLRQEGLFDDVPYAVADSGWIGTMQQTLKELLVSGGKEDRLTGYYFGLYEVPKNSVDIYKSYFFDPKKGLSRKVNFSNCLFEAVFTSTEGMTLQYIETSKGYEPVFDYKKNPNAELVENNIRILREYLKLYVGGQDSRHMGLFPLPDKSESFFRNKCGREGTTQSLKMVSSLLKGFMGYPTKEELEAYGNNLFSDDVLEGKLQKVAAELSDKEIRNQRFLNKAFIMTGIKKGIIHESAWIEGSIVRNQKNIDSNLRHARLYKYFVHMKKWLKQATGR